MGRDQLVEVLLQGKDIAKDYEKLNKKYSKLKKPVFLGGIILILIFSLLELILVSKTTGVKIFGILKGLFMDPQQFILIFVLNAIFLIFLMYIPMVNYLTSLFMNFIGLCFYYKKQKRLKNEIEGKLEQFFETTHIPEIYCDSNIVDKYIEYLDSYQADNLKECIRLQIEEERHTMMINELKKLKEGSS